MRFNAAALRPMSAAPGAADIVIQDELQVRGRRVGLRFGHTQVPACAGIESVDRGAHEWMRAIIAANR